MNCCLSAQAIRITEAGIGPEPAIEAPSVPYDAAKFNPQISPHAAAALPHAQGDCQSSSRHQDVGRVSRAEGRGLAGCDAALRISERQPAGICRSGCSRSRCSISSGFI